MPTEQPAEGLRVRSERTFTNPRLKAASDTLETSCRAGSSAQMGCRAWIMLRAKLSLAGGSVRSAFLMSEISRVNPGSSIERERKVRSARTSMADPGRMAAPKPARTGTVAVT